MLIFEQINKNRTHLGLIWRYLVKKRGSSLSSDFLGHWVEGFSLKTDYFHQKTILEVKQNNDEYFGVKR